ncbi:MAG: hypothetical protein GXP33_10515 [Spirochaetes bacterium]|nr:hypothetical protein [Spirochaetota bacterium]
MAMFGYFNYGRKSASIPREKTYSAYRNRVRSNNIPILVHPVVSCGDFSSGKFLELKGGMIELLHLEKDETKKWLLIRL